MAILGHGAWVSRDQETNETMADSGCESCDNGFGTTRAREDSATRRVRRRLVQRANRRLPGKGAPGRRGGLQARLGVVEGRCVALETELLAVLARRSSEVGGMGRLVDITERMNSELTRTGERVHGGVGAADDAAYAEIGEC